MAPKKASAGDRAAQFLAKIGTAGGAKGAPGLVGFGVGDMQQQIQSGNVDEYAPIRARAIQPGVGQPNAPQPSMPADLDAAYLKLNLPGSPLPRNGLLTNQFVDAAQYAQDQIVANEQRMMMQTMPFTGQLPVGLQPLMTRQKGSR